MTELFMTELFFTLFFFTQLALPQGYTDKK